jgi:hypothetical protein
MDRYLAYQNGRDLLTKFALETLWNAIWYWYGLVLHPPFLPKPTGALIPACFGCDFAALLPSIQSFREVAGA